MTATPGISNASECASFDRMQGIVEAVAVGLNTMFSFHISLAQSRMGYGIGCCKKVREGLFESTVPA